ncbi:MAG: hypothetical protein LLF94_02275 [Chlamydiales bacterium]|nr:hypothetical protein [Chlamydiales bacterium]
MNLRTNFIGKLCLLAMLANMQPQLSAAKAKKNNKHHKTSSSHSSSSKSTDKDCCKETLHGLKDIEKN